MDILGLFAKYWQPGHVKTRLAADIGEVAASRLSREFLVTLVRRFSAAAERPCLVFHPDSRRAAFAELAAASSLHPWSLVPQSAGDLGNRLAAFFEGAFAAGAQRVVVIGGDSPTLPAAQLSQAWQALEEHDLVLGPTEDGGYYLVGATAPTPPIFDHIPWSTPDVWETTVARAATCGRRLAVLPTWYDIDELQDLVRLRDELSTADSSYADLLACVQEGLSRRRPELP